MSNNFTSHFSADDAALLLIDFQPQMFMGVESHDRNAIKNNLQIIAKSAKLFNVPTVLSTVTAETFAGPFVPEVTEGVFPGHEVVDRTSINAWLTPNFVKAVEATQAEGFQGVHFSQIPKGPIENSLIIDETNTTDNDFNKQEKPMSTSSTIADSSAPSANHTIIRVGLIGVGNLCRNMKWRLSTASVATRSSLLRTPSASSISSDPSMNWFAIQTSTSSSCSRQVRSTRKQYAQRSLR